METIEIETTQHTKTTRQIKLPLYRKNDCHAFMVFSKEKCLCVCHGLESGLSIEICVASLAFNSSSSEDCSKEEFKELYISTAVKLNHIVNPE